MSYPGLILGSAVGGVGGFIASDILERCVLEYHLTTNPNPIIRTFVNCPGVCSVVGMASGGAIGAYTGATIGGMFDGPK